MIEQHIDIATADGAMNSFVVHPEEGGPFPVVLFYMDAPGYREELRDMARRLAAVGYFVVLPNLYYRLTRDFWLDASAPRQMMAHMFSLMATLDAATTLCDTDAMLRFVDASPRGRRPPDRRGRLLHERAVRDVGRRRPAGAARLHRLDPRRQHGDRQAGLAAPHRRRRSAARATSPAPRSTSGRRRPMSRSCRRRCRPPGTPHRLEWYPGVEHGFVFPLRPHAYDRAAAERHWERLFSLFDRTLRAPA